MHDRIIHAPLSQPSKIIDIGCGTGSECLDFSASYPDSNIYGVDLSPVPELAAKPANVKFIQGDVRKLVDTDLRLTPSSFEYAFSRLLVLGMTDWQGYINDVAGLLRPGGWFEVQDLSLEWYFHHRLISDTWPWLNALRARADIVGWDLDCGRNVASYMTTAGLIDVQQIQYQLPYGSWMADCEGKEETRAIGKHSAREYGMLYYHGVPKMLEGAGYGAEVVEKFQNDANRDLSEEEGKYMIFWVTIGRKPEE